MMMMMTTYIICLSLARSFPSFSEHFFVCFFLFFVFFLSVFWINKFSFFFDGWFWKNLKIHQFFVLHIHKERERRETRRVFIFKRAFVKEILALSLSVVFDDDDDALSSNGGVFFLIYYS